MDKFEIDYSAVQQPRIETPETWEPPPHVFYGKKMANGRSEKEPTYVYQEFPRMLYGMIEDRIRAAIVNTTAEKEALLAKGYRLSPAEWGIETCPGVETVIARKIEKEATEPVLEVETVEIVKRKPGRPKK